jgi:hypothetical protein
VVVAVAVEMSCRAPSSSMWGPIGSKYCLV